jgi:hypothetical protein
MGKYCKAYYVKHFRQFDGWSEISANLRKEKKQEDGQEQETVRDLGDDDFLYLQENFTVTDGIFIDENVIFDQVTPEWEEFCAEKLQFAMPADEPMASAKPESAVVS